MEDADFVADSEDELHSGEDLVLHRAVAVKRAPSGTSSNDQQQQNERATDHTRPDGEELHEQPQDVMQIDDGSTRRAATGARDFSGANERAARQDRQQQLHSSPVRELVHWEAEPAPAVENANGSVAEMRPRGDGDAMLEHEASDAEGPAHRPRVFQVGDLVEVEARTWPGINKPGGSGRVMNVHQETDAQGELEIFYDVRYVLGGFERRIESEYVELSHMLQLARAHGRVRYERVFYHDEFADELHKKKKAFYDPDAFVNAEHNRQDAVGPQTAKRKRSSTRRRSNDSDTMPQQRHNRESSTNDTNSERRPSALADESSSGGSESDDGQVIRRISDGTFVMDSSPIPTQSTQGEDPYTATALARDVNRATNTTAVQRDQLEAERRRRRRIVESDNESSGSEGTRRQRHQDQQQQQRYPQSPQKAHRHDEFRHEQRARVRTSKKRRRYVGGYLHNGDDVDATFIQPENNADALPDDVAREIGFKLGKSKAELKAQLAKSASSLTSNLRAFNDQKDLIDLKIRRASALTSEELRDFHRQTIELEGFLTQRLIRGGEDVMNAIIVKLTRKGGSLSDSVELVFDDQKREISALGVWIRKVLSALEIAFKVRGESLPSDDRHQQTAVGGDGEPVFSSSDLDRRYQSEDDNFYTNEYQYDGNDGSYQSRDLGATVKKPRNDPRRGNSGSVLRSPKRTSKGHYRSKKSQAVDTFMESYNSNNQQQGLSTDTAKQARRKAKYATSLDDFEFVQYTSEQQRDSFFDGEPLFRSSRSAPTRDAFQASNVRLPGKKRPMAPSDPRWDWLKQGRAKAQDQARASSTKSSFSGPSPSSSAVSTSQRSSNKNKNQEKLIGHVQNARLQLREKRYQKMRYPSGSLGGSVRGVAPSYVPTYGYDPPPMAARNESLALSTQQPRSHQPNHQQFSRFGESTAFEYAADGASGPVKYGFFKSTSTITVPTLSAKTQIEELHIKWENVFDVLSGAVDDEEIVGFRPERRTFLMTCGLLECSCGSHRPPGVDADHAALHQEDLSVEDLGVEVMIKRAMSRLRQDLNDLRFQEFEFLRSISGGGRSAEAPANEEARYSDSPEWRTLVDRADRYHASLASLVRHAVQSVQEQLEMATGVSSALAMVTRMIRAIAVEISHIVAKLPDCESLFSCCPSYVFFFEVADRNAKTTPLVTAITRTYWYCIQTLLDLKQVATATSVAGLTGAIEVAIESVLPTNRAILAAALFLVDLYLFLPSAYRLDHESSDQQQFDNLSVTEASTPAISLWLLLHDCFASGKCSFQTGKLSASGDGRDFWAFLQTMYRDHFLDQLAIAFVKDQSSGGYLVDSLPTISKASRDAEDVAEGQLLALQVVWDLCILFASIFPAAESKERDDVISEARWAVVKDLLQPGMHAFLPFSEALATQSRDKDLAVYSGAYKLHVLQKMLVLSKLSAPQSDVLERLLEELWEDSSYSVSSQKEQGDLVELSPFVADLLMAALSESGNALIDFVNARKWGAADHIDMISGVVLTQILKFEKAIHRNRFRQPICRSISARCDATKSAEDGTRAQVAPPPSTTVQVHAKAAAAKPKAWNWGASGSASDLSKTATKNEELTKAQPPKSIKRGRDEERLMVSIMLSLAVSSIYQDAATTTSPLELRDPSQRANKSLKRDLEFYYKEMARIVNGHAEFGVLLSQALYMMGRLAMELSNEYASIFSYLNDHLLASVQALRAQRSIIQSDKDSSATAKRLTRLLQRGVLATLYLMRNLTQRLCEIIPSIPESPSSYAMDAVRSSLSFILNAGLEACLDAAVDELLPIDALSVALEILQCVLPRVADEPVQCLQVIATTAAEPVESNNEFDEFDDDMWASVDLDSLTATASSSSADKHAVAVTKPSSLKTFEDSILQSILTHLRLGLQRAVIKYPQRGLASYHELFAIELLGVMVSTCSFQFGWSLVSASSMKPRVLAPRLFSAILKSHPEKEWFSTCFLSETGADQELANIWLMGTLDLQALFPSLCTLQASQSTSSSFPIPSSSTSTKLVEPTSGSQIRYSNYWVMLTDAMIYNILRENPVAQYKMDPLLLQLLRATATNSKFVHTLQKMKQTLSASSSLQPPNDLRTLYELHLDVFQEFCRGAGDLWRRLASNPMLHRPDMNRFRLKMMDIQSGVFATFPEAYEINLKMVCQDLDRTRHNWYDLSEKFVQDFASPVSSSSPSGAATATNYHCIDESLELAHHDQQEQLKEDPSVRILIVLFKFMYGCVDTFLFHCGAMAIGQQNIFFSVMKLMFRQASCAEFPQAEKRLLQLQLALAASHNFDSHHQTKWFESSDPQSSSTNFTSANKANKGQKQQTKGSISPACLGFVESVRLFFARQKYPSLIHWFSQTLETYQTVKRGWSSSPLRKLLLNVLDPHGPLGIHSYYPIEAAYRLSAGPIGRQHREFDVRQVRREAFYLSCGLFFCRCTNSYEHSRHSAPSADASAAQNEARARLRTLRKFILNDFIQETFDYAAGDQVCLHETLVPVAQFLRAVLSHCNMNVQHQNSSGGQQQMPEFDFQVREMYYCLESVLLYCVKTLQAERVLQSSISCVLVLELCGIVEELVMLNDTAFDSEVSTLLELTLAYFKEIFAALGKTSANALEPLFVQPYTNDTEQISALPTTAELLTSFRPLSAHGVHGITFEVSASNSAASGAFDEYGISRVRIRADLVVSIGRLAERCKRSSDFRLRRFVE